jgi:hypothetical protein
LKHKNKTGVVVAPYLHSMLDINIFSISRDKNLLRQTIQALVKDSYLGDQEAQELMEIVPTY